MNKTTVSLPRMDCAAEERLVRMALDGLDQIRRIDANLSVRKLTVLHEGSAAEVVALLAPLNLGAEVVETTTAAGRD